VLGRKRLGQPADQRRPVGGSDVAPGRNAAFAFATAASGLLDAARGISAIG